MRDRHSRDSATDPGYQWNGSIVDWLFRSRVTGKITIAQFPNIALATFLGAVVAQRFLPDNSLALRFTGWLRTASLTWWALDEVLRGVNPWRRLLGLTAVLTVLAGLLTH